MTLDHDLGRRAKKARLLVVGERCHVLGPGKQWIDTFVTGITDCGRSYETQVEATGKQFTRNRFHIRPRSPDIPHMHASFLQRNAVPSATSDRNAPSERENSVNSGHQQLANGQKTSKPSSDEKPNGQLERPTATYRHTEASCQPAAVPTTARLSASSCRKATSPVSPKMSM